MADGRDLSGELFGGGGRTSVDTWRSQLGLDQLEEQHGLPSGLMTAVLRQESGGDPRVKSSAGAQGLFQFMPATAAQYKIDPFDPQQAAPAAAKELRSLYTKYGGDVDRTLAAWNWGQGNVDRQGLANMPRETRGFLTNVKRFLSPGVAEAATQAQTGGRDLSQALFGTTAPPGGRDLSQAVEAPASPQAPAPSSQTAPGPSTQPGASQAPETRFLQLPSIQQLPPAVRQQRLGEFRGLRPDLQAEFLASEEPPSQLTIAIEKPSTPQAAPPAPTRQQALASIEPLDPTAASRMLAERRHEQGIPLSAVPAIAVNTLGTVGGAALGAPLGPVGSAAGAALGGSLATRANTAMGLTGQEKPLLETPFMNVYPSDLLGAIPLGVAGTTAAVKGTVRTLPGANVGRHELAAEKLAQLGQRTMPARPSSELFTEAAAQGGAVPTTHLWRAAGKVVREEQGMEKGFVSTEAMQAGSGLMSLMRKHGGNVPLDELEKYRQRLFQKIQTTTDKAELKRLQDLYGAVHEDLAQAATRGTAAGAGTLKEAIAAKRKEHAHETLTDIWSPGKGLQLQEGAHTQIYGKRIRNEVEKRLHQDKLFAGSFTAAEVVDMRNTLREVGKLTRVTNPDAQGTVGSTLKWLGRLGGAGYGATTGDLLTGGAMILATEGASAVLSSIMQSKLGRLALREAIREGNGTLTHGSLSAIAALVAREAAPKPETAPTP